MSVVVEYYAAWASRAGFLVRFVGIFYGVRSMLFRSDDVAPQELRSLCRSEAASGTPPPRQNKHWAASAIIFWTKLVSYGR